MDAVRTLVEGIKHADQLIDEDVLEPDPGRDDWPRMKARIDLVERAINDEVLASLDEALAEAENDEVRAVIRRRVAALVGAAAALELVSGNRRVGFEQASKAAKIASDPEQQSELAAAGDDAEGYVLLWHGRWLQEHGRRADSDRVLRVAARKAKSPALQKAAKQGLRAPRPLTSAPPLFRLNGCGVGLYGERDRRPDGSYIATYCLCIFFIPVLPLTAYRVRDAGERRYQFSTHESLSPFTRGLQIALLSCVVLAAGWGGVASFLDSPSHQANVALDAAHKAEAAGDREGAIEKYNAAIKRFAFDAEVNLDDASEAVVRLAAAGVAEPCTAASTERIGRVVNTFYELPEGTRRDKGATLLSSRLSTWAGQIGEATPTDAEAALTVLDLGARVARTPAEKAAIEERRTHVRRALAERVAVERPLRALALYTQSKGDPESIARGRAIIESFGAAPSLWIEADRDVEAWLGAAGPASAASGFQERLTRARALHAEDLTKIEAGDEKQLAKALAASPGDQELAVAVAAAQRRRGESKAALATLTALGPPGRMTGTAQQLLGACYADADDLARADAVLTAFLAERLGPFQQAQRDYAAAETQLQQRLIADAKAGRFDFDLKRKLDLAAETEQGTLLRAWMSERMDKDPELTALRTEYLRHGAVVSASLALGTYELRRANAATGEERKALLASAEKVFLSIRQEAEGDPSFHLGLGQVLHRLGRGADGDVELGHVLEKKQPQLTLAVVNVYRDLGLPARAKQIAEALYDESTDPNVKHGAASILAHLVNEVGFDEDAEEMWLKRSDVTAEGVKSMRFTLEARRLLRAGKNAEADRAYAAIAEIHERGAKSSATSANNAAIAYLSRFSATGDPASLRAALKHLENARRLDPQSALVLGNLASSLELQGSVTVLERWVRTRALLLDNGSARSVLGTLLAGPLHDEVLAALKQDPSLHRSLELGQEEQALSPQRKDAYVRQIRWLTWTEDDAGLLALQKRLEGMPPFDAQDTEKQRREWAAKESDQRLQPIFVQGVSQAREVVRRAQQGAHAPTLAAAWMLLGSAVDDTLPFDTTAANLDAMIDAHRKGAEAWPEGGMPQDLAGSLVIAAFHRAAAETPALRKAWDAEGRSYGSVGLLRRALRGPDGAAITAALRARPEIGEAVRLRKTRPEKQLTTFDVLLAQIAGDADLEKAARGVFHQASSRAALEIAARLEPGQAREKAELDAFLEDAKGP